MTKYRGKGGRATDGDNGWPVKNVDHVGETPPGYVPPHDPTNPLPAEEAKAAARPRDGVSPFEVVLGSGCCSIVAFIGLGLLWKFAKWAFLS